MNEEIKELRKLFKNTDFNNPTAKENFRLKMEIFFLNVETTIGIHEMGRNLIATTIPKR
jgi:hypothetical protein